uniref:Uncharacterized protein n=1 Tax=Populus trichocarpa TaxID=3694 RepID=B9HUN1_POPTR
MEENVCSIRGETSKADQTHVFTCIDSELYKAAAEGETETFLEYTNQLQCLVTPNRNTVLHIYITALSEKIYEPINRVPEISKAWFSSVPQKLQRGVSNVPPPSAKTKSSQFLMTLKGVRRSKTDAKNDYQNDTALYGAERHDHIAVVSKSTKDDPDFVYAENDAGETPLYMALERGFKNMVAQILGTCTAAIYQGPDGRTALRAAVYYND